MSGYVPWCESLGHDYTTGGRPSAHVAVLPDGRGGGLYLCATCAAYESWAISVPLAQALDWRAWTVESQGGRLSTAWYESLRFPYGVRLEGGAYRVLDADGVPEGTERYETAQDAFLVVLALVGVSQ